MNGMDGDDVKDRVRESITDAGTIWLGILALTLQCWVHILLDTSEVKSTTLWE